MLNPAARDLRGWRNPPEASKLTDLVAFGDRTTLTTLYVLKSSAGTRYVGITKNIQKWLKQHNSGRNFSTKGRGNYLVILEEKYFTYQEARVREKFLKSGAGRKFLDNLQS